MSKPHQRRPKQRALRSAPQDRQRPESRVQRKPAAIAPPVERGRLVVGGHDLGPAELNPQTGVIEAGPHVAKRHEMLAEADGVTIVLPYSLVKAIERYNQTLWSAKSDPSRLGALNAVAYIGEQVAAILRTSREKAKP